VTSEGERLECILKEIINSGLSQSIQ
jgi:hypothetical protein